MNVIKHRKIYYGISVLIIGLSVLAIAVFGLNLGIDFKGGSIIEAKFEQQTDINPILAAQNHNEAVVRTTADNGYIVRTHAMTQVEQEALNAAITSAGGTITSLNTVGPVLGEELQKKALISIILVVLAIVAFITYAFRRVSEPIASWKYGAVAIITLAHDVIVPLGVFAFLGRNGSYEIDTLFITALLVILGFSVHDTIVVFDRTRENLKHGELKKNSFEHVVGMSVSQTFSRSINTSLTTILALVVLWFLGPITTRNFSLAMIIGILVGTYSSIFIASPLLVTLEKLQAKKQSKLAK